MAGVYRRRLSNLALRLLGARESAGLASFITAETGFPELAHFGMHHPGEAARSAGEGSLTSRSLSSGCDQKTQSPGGKSNAYGGTS